MIKNDQRYVLSFGSRMGCYLILALIYLEVACDVVHLHKKDIELRMKSYVFYDTLVCLRYSSYAYVFISYNYV